MSLSPMRASTYLDSLGVTFRVPKETTDAQIDQMAPARVREAENAGYQVTLPDMVAALAMFRAYDREAYQEMLWESRVS